MGLLSWIVFYHSDTLPLLAFSQGKSMRIRMHFHNLHSENQDVSASSQQLHESCFLVRLARKQQFISRGTWGLKTRPSEHKKGILTKSKPRGTTHRQPPSREMAADAQPLQSSPRHMAQLWGCPELGKAAQPQDDTAACMFLLSFVVTWALEKVPSHSWDATCQLAACAFPALPLLSLPLSPFVGSATQ